MTANEACKKVLEELLKLSPEELQKKLDEHIPTGIGELLAESGHFETLEKAIEKFEDKNE